MAQLKAFGDKLCCGYRTHSFPLAFRPNLIEAAANTQKHTLRPNVQLQQVQADRLRGGKKRENPLGNVDSNENSISTPQSTT